MSDSKSGSDNGLAMMGVAGVAVLCCAGPIVVGVLGLGTVLAALTSWWVLIPVGLAAVGTIGWFAWRRSCRARGAVAPGVEDQESGSAPGRMS